MGGIISAEPMPSSSEYPMISCGSPNDSSASTPPTPYTIRPSTKHRLRPRGRKRCFVLGLIVYGVGGVLALLSFGLPQLIIGYSLLEGIGSALMIPPIYIL